MIRSSVVLPQPLGPRKQTNSPSPTSSVTRSRATTAPNRLAMPSRATAAALHGLLPDFVYSAMFLSSASRYFQPSASFIRWRIDATDRYPVPEEAGFGMTISPL